MSKILNLPYLPLSAFPISLPMLDLAPTLRATQRRQTFLSPPSVAPSVALEPSLSFSSMSYSSGYCSEEPQRLRTCSSRSFSSGIGTRTGASCSECNVFVYERQH